VARLDGGQYDSTMDALTNLYPKLSVGGYLMLDDCGAALACCDAVHDFRKTHNIEEEIRRVDDTCVYWQRTTRNPSSFKNVVMTETTVVVGLMQQSSASSTRSLLVFIQASCAG
jgi:Macrocin-O-methyltransferase (TylF)